MRYSKNFRRIAFFFFRETKLAREWFRGTMLYARRNPKWFVRVFELGNGINEALLEFGSLRPDGIISCGTPVRFLRDFFSGRGMGDVPIFAFPQTPYPGIGVCTVDLDHAATAEKAIELFKRRGCRHVVYVGAHLPNGVRLSRQMRRAFVAAAEKAGLSYSVPSRKVYDSIGIRVGECDIAMRQLMEFPKPCGILAYDDGIGRDILDLCRLLKLDVPGSVCVLGMDDDCLVCENATPTLSSIPFSYEDAAFQAAKALDEMIAKREKTMQHLICSPGEVVERASTQDPKGVGRLVSLACEYIAKNACRRGGIDRWQIAAQLGVSIRTLEMAFAKAKFPRTILQEIQRVQLSRLCRLLSTTNRPIGELIFESGFTSASRAKAYFASKLGMGMRDYRKSKTTTPPPPQL